MLSIEAKRKKEALFRNYASNVDFVLNTPLHEQRRIWEEGAINVPLPENVSTEIVDEEGISAEWVRHSQAEKRKVILYLHGGGNSQDQVSHTGNWLDILSIVQSECPHAQLFISA